MENVIYRGIVVTAKASNDGETPTLYEVTKEANGYAIWYHAADCHYTLVRFEPHRTRDQAIEEAVKLTLVDRGEKL